MPIIHYLCDCGNAMSKFFRQAKESPAFFLCTKCEKNAKKILKAPSSTSVVSIDNGIQARAVEVNLEVVEDIRARSTKDFKGD
jgi:hypothetical protein